MAEKVTDHNATPLDGDTSGLRGGTQGGGGPVPVPGGPGTGGSNAVQGAGGSHVSGRTDRHGSRNDSRDDPEALFEGSRHNSQSEAKQRARDAADVGTEPGTPHSTGGENRTHQIHPTDPDQPNRSRGDAPH